MLTPPEIYTAWVGNFGDVVREFSFDHTTDAAPDDALTAVSLVVALYWPGWTLQRVMSCVCVDRQDIIKGPGQ